MYTTTKGTWLGALVFFAIYITFRRVRTRVCRYSCSLFVRVRTLLPEGREYLRLHRCRGLFPVASRTLGFSYRINRINRYCLGKLNA